MSTRKNPIREIIRNHENCLIETQEKNKIARSEIVSEFSKLLIHITNVCREDFEFLVNDISNKKLYKTNGTELSRTEIAQIVEA